MNFHWPFFRKPAAVPPGYIPAPPREPNGRFISPRPNRRAELEAAIADIPADLRRDACEYAKQRPVALELKAAVKRGK